MIVSANILIVEGENVVAQELQMFIESLGYNVCEIVNSGELAIKKVAELQPNLILMNIRIIEETDDITTAQIIAKQFEIPVIYMTVHSDEVTFTRAKKHSLFGYIIKPFNERDLGTTIEIALYKHSLEKHSKENARWLTTILQSINDGIITTDSDGCITFLNPIAEKLTGWSLDEAVGKEVTKVFNIINENNRFSLNNPITQVLKTGENTSLPENTLLIGKNGNEVPIEDSMALSKQSKFELNKNSTEKANGAALVFRDVSKQRLATQKLYRQAFYDELTNLPNRIWFKKRVASAIERFTHNSTYLFAVLLLDLDRFKTINDSLGHSTGDCLLFNVTHRLLKSVRPNDVVARLGGDEFAIFLENLTTTQEVDLIAQRIGQELREPFNLEGREIYTNASIGIVLSSIGYYCVEDLLRDADIAMYRAKNKGKGCYEIFYLGLRDRVVAASQLENDLRGAIDRGELEVYYQPIISLSDRKTEGFEALVRWHHPQRGMILPAEFIPIAEEIGLFVQLDMWVLQQACHQMKIWQEQYSDLPHLSISVNLSIKQFKQPNLIREIEQILKETSLDSCSLKLEIIESALIDNPELSSIILEQLKELGVVLSLDDFGTGYSSLNYLHRFPVDILKIDRSFINRIYSQQDSLEIVRTIIMLGQNLGIDVVAEGIETEKQLTLLQQLQCQYGQGYLFSKPMSVSEVEIWLKNIALPKPSE
jgi:diguanylate cyclase (GGDEF)-like protein/PAS domain S-box-containing protein